jgi:hypothetical protein
LAGHSTNLPKFSRKAAFTWSSSAELVCAEAVAPNKHNVVASKTRTAEHGRFTKLGDLESRFI